MTAPESPAKDETPPLSPEAKALIGRARRSFLFSIGVLLLGFIAIAVVLVYKASRDSSHATAPAAYAAQSLHLPQGAEIVSAVAANGSVSVTYRVGPALQMRVFDGQTGALTQQMDIVID